MNETGSVPKIPSSKEDWDGKQESWTAAWRSFMADRRRLFIIVVIGLPLIALLTYWIISNFIFPSQYTIAVVRGSPDANVMKELAATPGEKFASSRLAVVEFDDSKGIRDALVSGKANLGVLRSDTPFPVVAQSVLILREESLAIIAPDGKTIDDLASLRDKKLGLVSRVNEGEGFLRNALTSAGVAPSAIEIFDEPAKALAAMKSGSIAAIVLISAADTGGIARAIRPVSDDPKTKIKFVDFPDIESLAAVNPGLAEQKLAAGSVIRKPAFPAEERTIVKTEMRLVAHTKLDRTDLAEIVLRLYSNRIPIARRAPSVNLIKTIDNDYVTSSLFPVHPGALDYFRREQMNFYQRYNDEIWLVLLYGGSVMSALGWLVQSGLKRGRLEEKNILKAMSEIIEDIHAARGEADIDRLQQQGENLVRHAMFLASAGRLSHRRISAILLGQNAIRDALETMRSRNRTIMAAAPVGGVAI